MSVDDYFTTHPDAAADYDARVSAWLKEEGMYCMWMFPSAGEELDRLGPAYWGFIRTCIGRLLARALRPARVVEEGNLVWYREQEFAGKAPDEIVDAMIAETLASGRPLAFAPFVFLGDGPA